MKLYRIARINTNAVESYPEPFAYLCGRVSLSVEELVDAVDVENVINTGIERLRVDLRKLWESYKDRLEETFELSRQSSHQAAGPSESPACRRESKEQ